MYPLIVLWENSPLPINSLFKFIVFLKSRIQCCLHCLSKGFIFFMNTVQPFQCCLVAWTSTNLTMLYLSLPLLLIVKKLKQILSQLFRFFFLLTFDFMISLKISVMHLFYMLFIIFSLFISLFLNLFDVFLHFLALFLQLTFVSCSHLVVHSLFLSKQFLLVFWHLDSELNILLFI